jgi:D-lactate dehydrogenase (cytochrome)
MENKPNCFFPVDPTEKSASFGGITSTNASGARSFYYSSVRNWVDELEVVLVTGKVLTLRRGIDKLDGLTLQLDGNHVKLFEIEKPGTKNSIGYFCEKNCDLVDIFIGAEGTLGVITKLKIRLEKKTKSLMSFLQFFKTAKDALNFVSAVRNSMMDCCISLEFFDSNAVAIGLENKESISQQIENFYNSDKRFIVLSEYLFKEEDDSLTDLLTKLEEIVRSTNGNFEDSISGFQDSEIAVIKKFRHSVPEGINKKIAKRKLLVPEIRKIATDMAVPNDFLIEIYDLYNSVLLKHNLEFSVLGHAGNNHFHVNLLPKTKEEMATALDLYEGFATKVVSMGGAVSAEHGIGRIKKKFLKHQYSEEVLAKMKAIKLAFDPNFQLNAGVLFDI